MTICSKRPFISDILIVQCLSSTAPVMVAGPNGSQATGALQQEKEEEGEKRQKIRKKRRRKEKEVTRQKSFVTLCHLFPSNFVLNVLFKVIVHSITFILFPSIPLLLHILTTSHGLSSPVSFPYLNQSCLFLFYLFIYFIFFFFATERRN